MSAETRTRTLLVKVKPGARGSSLQQQAGGSWLAQVQSPPVDGKANAHLLKFLATQFGVPPTSVSLQSGAGGRQKTVLIRAPRRLPDAIPIAKP